ncbi:unnamed protein product [Vitrella brassicaformis CCMP3155]|uniref:SET domain-containing protein n=2 Tax=Vitrella brassicaformis TaxID=1169539 RepID=A0A0G4FQA5_VITBC|nr:unnamed protein product [Vitrella brassicaformis CCMP3155]|eukprot:CEM16016.1 unnamed protein product [Vitrella brassicaformis CCMP3155]
MKSAGLRGARPRARCIARQPHPSPFPNVLEEHDASDPRRSPLRFRSHPLATEVDPHHLLNCSLSGSYVALLAKLHQTKTFVDHSSVAKHDGRAERGLFTAVPRKKGEVIHSVDGYRFPAAMRDDDVLTCLRNRLGQTRGDSCQTPPYRLYKIWADRECIWASPDIHVGAVINVAHPPPEAHNVTWRCEYARGEPDGRMRPMTDTETHLFCGRGKKRARRRRGQRSSIWDNHRESSDEESGDDWFFRIDIVATAEIAAGEEILLETYASKGRGSVTWTMKGYDL